MYTLVSPDGERDLFLENGLSGLEAAFCRVRDETLMRGAPLSPKDEVIIKAFMAAMHVRTPAQREHQRSQWGELLQMAESMTRQWKAATPAQRSAMTMAPGPSRGTPIDLEDLRETVDRPMQAMFLPMFQAEFSGLMPLDIVVMQTKARPGFITSDAPCVWFDPDAYKRPPMLQSPGLIYPKIEISLPVSPSLLVCLNRRGVHGYVNMRDEFVDAQINRRTRVHADQNFVVNRNMKVDIWFDPGVEPEDS